MSEPDIFDLITSGQLGEDGNPKPKPRSREDLLVARVLNGSNLEYAYGNLKDSLRLFNHLVKDKNIRMVSPKGEALTQKDFARLYMEYYVEVAHSNNHNVVYPPQPGEAPMVMERVIDHILAEPKIASAIKSEY
jgi:hypothetical protein